jgi:EpsI family protein
MGLPSRRSVVLAGLMAAASAGSVRARPGEPGPNPFSFDEAIPRAFGAWRELESSIVRVVDPEAKTLQDIIYSQLVSRTYVNAAADRVMLSLAYGEDQRGSKTAHPPEICYRAQGFDVRELRDVDIATPFGGIAGRRFDARKDVRREPVSYWFNAGGTPIRSQLELRWVQIRLGLSGNVPDGLLFRVSSIDADPARAYAVHERFIADLLQSVVHDVRTRLGGLQLA